MALALAIVLLAMSMSLLVIGALPICRLSIETRARLIGACGGFFFAGLVSFAVSSGHDLRRTWLAFLVLAPLLILLGWWVTLGKLRLYRDDYAAHLDKLPESERKASWLTDLAELYFDIDTRKRSSTQGRDKHVV